MKVELYKKILLQNLKTKEKVFKKKENTTHRLNDRNKNEEKISPTKYYSE